MWVERPDLEVYTGLCDKVADLKDKVLKLEHEHEKLIAHYLKEAMERGAKTRELDVVKVIGNTEKQEKELEKLIKEIFSTKKEILLTQGNINVWLASKDLYVTDSYHQIRGTGKFLAESGQQ